MKTVRGYIATSKFGSDCEFEFEVDDDTSEEEIEQLAKEAAFDRIEWNYSVEDSE